MDIYPDIFPDYIHVTIPVNIAPLNFRLSERSGQQAMLYIQGEGKSVKISSSGKFRIPLNKWKELLKNNSGGKLKLTIYENDGNVWKRYKPFSINVASEPVDPYLVYRLIEPGYKLWNKMGLYQRTLEEYQESAIFENKMSGYNCVNCHSFYNQEPEKMLFHMRGLYAGTFLIQGESIEKIDTKTGFTVSPFVYPSWHPSGKYIAFSVNKTDQNFYVNNKNRIEVFDTESDIVIYDIEKREAITAPQLFSENSFETFPCFSPDGKTLYFCSASVLPVPEKFDSVRYNLCRISFNVDNQSFGEEIDTLYHSDVMGKSATFPRVSPDGKFLLFTICGYGTFPVWHKDSDLCLYNLETKKYVNLDSVNSNDVDSYHSWSSNSRWFVFSSRRGDGLYTRPYIAYVNKDGKTGKAFMLPQKDPDYYDALMKSYNIPEFVKGKVKTDQYKIARQAKSFGKSVTFPNPD